MCATNADSNRFPRADASRAHKKHTIAYFRDLVDRQEKHNRSNHPEEEGLLRELNPGPLAP